MKISIITVCYNSETYLESAIKSVISQNYENIEYIIIDGGSTDTSVDIIKKYQESIDYWHSKPDEGIYDAMNQGIQQATGDVIGFLNSDDYYTDNYAISQMTSALLTNGSDTIFADLVYINQNNKVVRYYDSSIFTKKRFAYGIMPAHPTFFAKSELFKKFGLFDTSFNIAADFELIARFLSKHKATYSYVKSVWVTMRTGGVSTSYSSIWVNTKEQIRACKINDISANIFTILLKYPLKARGLLPRK